jgi:hypothetical protein
MQFSLSELGITSRAAYQADTAKSQGFALISDSNELIKNETT